MLRFDPFRDLDRLTEQLLGTSAGTSRAPRLMPIDIYRSGERYVLRADLPGADSGSIDVNVENGTLTIRGERSPDPETAEWITNERFTGTYQRQLSLGEGVDTGNISASYDDGVLTVTIPVAEKAKPRKIEVSGGGGHKTITPEATA